MNLEYALSTPGWMAEGELVWLAQRAYEARVIVEVGAWKGRTTLALAENTNGRVYAVDHWRGSDPEHIDEIARNGPDSVFNDFSANLARWIGDGRVRTLRMDSADAAEWLARVDGLVDLVFIDAGHSYEECKRDISSYLGIVRCGGILAGHDYDNPQFPGVRAAVDEAFPGIVQRVGLSIWWVQL